METIKIKFDSLAAGGDAIGRDEAGRAVFVPRAAPGDCAEVAVLQQRKSFAHGSLVRLIEASTLRVEPPCPYFDRGDITASCGGCSWQHLESALQLRTKRSIVRDALHRIGGIADAEEKVAECLASPNAFHYRNKADFVVAFHGDGSSVGFFAPDSHRLIDIDTCLIQQQPNNELLAAVRDAISSMLAPPFETATGRGVLRRIVARTASNGDMLVCAVTTSSRWTAQNAFAAFLRARLPRLVGVLRREPKGEAKLIAGTGDSGRDWLEEEVDGLRLRVRGEGFFQVNTVMIPNLLRTGLEMAAIKPGERALDLFCGVGLFSLGMARLGAQVTGIERSRAAIIDARANAETNGLKARFLDGDATTVLRGLRARGESGFDCVLLDPPRAGAAETIPEIVRHGARRIVYVSCDPATLARDAKALREAGYELERAVPLDLFPQTAHVETAALFVRPE